MSLRHDDHSSSPSLAAWIERPTRGFILQRGLRRTEGSTLVSRAHSVSRASSPLLFGLAPRGVCLASVIAAGAVGSYPTLSTLPAQRSVGRHPEGFPPGYHRDALRRRYILCGTFRDAAITGRVPWRYQAHCPTLLSQSGVRTFLPRALLYLPVDSGQASDRPAHPPSLLYRATRRSAGFHASAFKAKIREPTQADRSSFGTSRVPPRSRARRIVPLPLHS